MAKQNKPKRPENLGKGKVTPVQVAFIVDRYLADNNYTNALAAFRSEASDLFSKTKGKEVPKGLLGLGEILNEYISLKEQRVMLDQEKKRVEMAMQGMQDVMRVYHSVGNPTLPSSPPLVPPQFVSGSVTPTIPPVHPNTGSPPGQRVNTSYPPITYPIASNPVISHKIPDSNNISTPITNLSCTAIANNNNKRKASKAAPKAPPAPKKPCIQSSLRTLPQSAQEQKSLDFSSPVTPQTDKSIVPIENPLTGITNSKCSIISSERIIVSPLKGGAYYSVERSYQITSPFKKSGKREHVKGKLDFDCTEVNTDSDAIITQDQNNNNSNDNNKVSGSCSSSDEEKEGDTEFDFDFPDFEIFNGDFSFSELLVDLDLDSNPVQSDQVERNEQRLEQDMDGGLVLHDSSKDPITESPDTDIQGPDSVTSIRAITKRIKIVSPAKARRNS